MIFSMQFLTKAYFTYIEDLIDGMIRALALHGGPTASDTFNLTYGNARSILELANTIKEIIPDVTFECRPKAEDKPTRGTLKMDKAEDRLGFKPKWPLEKGYKKYCEWYVSEWEKVIRSNA